MKSLGTDKIKRIYAINQLYCAFHMSWLLIQFDSGRADLNLYFPHMQKAGFLMARLIYILRLYFSILIPAIYLNVSHFLMILKGSNTIP